MLVDRYCANLHSGALHTRNPQGIIKGIQMGNGTLHGPPPLKSKKECNDKKNAKKGLVQDEYIRNLQHQIYLLELETRYLYWRMHNDLDGVPR